MVLWKNKQDNKTHEREKRENVQINQIKDERWEIKSDILVIHNIMRCYYEQLNIKMANLEDKDRFLVFK